MISLLSVCLVSLFIYYLTELGCEGKESGSQIIVCRPLPTCSYINSPAARLSSKKLHSLHICEPGSLRVLKFSEMSKEVLLKEVSESSSRTV
jgi:hypothetical protein